MTRPTDLTGIRCGSLTASHRLPSGKWLCVCDCGNTVERKTEVFNQTRTRGGRSSCGCKDVKPVRYAYLYRGELRSVPDLARIADIDPRVLYKWAKQGKLSELTLDGYMQRKAVRKQRAAQMQTTREAG